MPPSSPSRRRLLLLCASVLASMAAGYSVLWMVSVRRPVPYTGLAASFSPQARALEVESIAPESPHFQAGLRAGDRILAVNGKRLHDLVPFYEAVVLGRVGDRVELTVERPGHPDPIAVHLELTPPPRAEPGRALLMQLLSFYPILFLAVGVAVLFLRLEDPHAWRLAMLFAAFIGAAPLIEGGIPAALRGFAAFYSVVFGGMTAVLFYYFFSLFPARSPIDRRVPWLKHLALAAALLAVLPLGLWCWMAGGSRPLYEIAWLTQNPALGRFLLWSSLGLDVLGLVSLVWNAVQTQNAEARRKARVMVWGAVAGVGPLVLVVSFLGLTGSANIYRMPFWVWGLAIGLLASILPASFAYAVVKHRVMEIPVLLRRSARYILVQRGFVVFMVLVGTAAALLFVLAGLRLARLFETEAPFSVPAVVLAAVSFGSLLALAGEQIHRRVSQRIDRAFFRSAYDARQILQGLAEATRKVGNRRELAVLLESQIEEALHPASVVAFVDSPAGGLVAVSGRTEVEPRTIPTGWPLLAELTAKAHPWDATPARAADLSWLAPLRPECLVPMPGRAGTLEGLLVLGPRLSEEPYSREDKRLLETVASQSAVALESLRLAEQMAERIEYERRAAYEMGIALQVQAKLFPQRRPPLRTLDYVGDCVQAREIGGDYYDFLDMGPGRVGLVLADISGKGISAALLMANLQANLRSQYALALHDLPRFLASVNRLFHESTSPQHYATMFFGDYDDSTRRLRYANCGHNPPVLLRAGGDAELLGATATVLGLFDNWQTSVGETEIRPGDKLLIFSDGAPDARSDNDEMFGDERVVETLRKHAHLSSAGILESFISEIQVFSGREREDDLTLVVARGL